MHSTIGTPGSSRTSNCDATAVEKLGELAEETGEMATEAAEGLLCKPTIQDAVNVFAETSRVTFQGIGPELTNAATEVAEVEVYGPVPVTEWTHTEWIDVLTQWNQLEEYFYRTSTLENGLQRMWEAYYRALEVFGYDPGRLQQ